MVFVGAASMLLARSDNDDSAGPNPIDGLPGVTTTQPLSTQPRSTLETIVPPQTGSSLAPDPGPSTAVTTIPGNPASSSPSYTVAPPPTGVTVPPFPGEIRAETDIIQFRDGSTVEYLTLVNAGGGEADWQMSVGAASGLRLSQTGGRMRAGDTVNVEINLIRDAGPDVSDWSTQLVVLGGGTTRPARILVKVFPVA